MQSVCMTSVSTSRSLLKFYDKRHASFSEYVDDRHLFLKPYVYEIVECCKDINVLKIIKKPIGNIVLSIRVPKSKTVCPSKRCLCIFPKSRMQIAA